MKKKYRYGIIADLIRVLSNTSSSGINLNDTETENALQDVANIMDTMMMNNCGFDKAIKIERENDESFGEWLEEVIQVIER